MTATMQKQISLCITHHLLKQLSSILNTLFSGLTGEYGFGQRRKCVLQKRAEKGKRLLVLIRKILSQFQTICTTCVSKLLHLNYFSYHSIPFLLNFIKLKKQNLISNENILCRYGEAKSVNNISCSVLTMHNYFPSLLKNMVQHHNNNSDSLISKILWSEAANKQFKQERIK